MMPRFASPFIMAPTALLALVPLLALLALVPLLEQQLLEQQLL